MSILQITAIALIGTVCAVVLKQQKSEFALAVSLITGFVLLLMISDALFNILNTVRDMMSRLNINQTYTSAVIKALGISYLTEFASQSAKDAGQGAIALKTELAGRVCLLIIAMPVIIAMINTIIELI